MAFAAGSGNATTLHPAGEVTLPPRVRRVLATVWASTAGDLSRQLQVLQHDAELELGRLVDQSRGTEAGDRYAEALRSLRQLGPELAPRFLERMEAAIGDLHAPRVSRRFEGLTAQGDGWNLVEATDTDEGAVLGDIASRADLRNNLALQLMGQRFGVLAGAAAFEAEHLPLGPHALCHALRDTCASLGMPLDARLSVYKAFAKLAMPQLPTLLDTLNALLAREDVLPHLTFVPVRRRPGAAMRDIDASTPLAPPPDPTAPAAPVPVPHSPTEGFSALQDLLARRRALLAKLRSGGLDDRSRALLSHVDVRDALRRMRAGSGKEGTPGDIRQTLLAQARQAHGHGVALGDADSDGFELFGLFMGQLQREVRAGSPGEALVKNLQLPLLQLALRDHRFFVEPEHPARKLLDAVSLAAARWLGDDDLDPQWLGLLHRAVAMVQADPEAAGETFVATNQALQAGLQALERKNQMAERRHVEAARGREKLELARLRASTEIARLIAGRALPHFPRLLLEQAWTDVLALVLLRNGEDSEGWRDMRAATIAMVDASVDPARSSQDPAFQQKLHDALSHVGYHAEDASLIARQLANGHADNDGLASRTELVMQLKARGRLGQGKLDRTRSPELARSSIEQAAYGRLSEIGEGCWIDIQDAAHGSVVRRRLAWTGGRSGQVLLLNRRSGRIDGEDLDGLARKLAAGTLHVVADTHPAELAWQATLTNLQRIASDHSSSRGTTDDGA